MPSALTAPRRTAPTTTGTPISSVTDWISARASALANGSMSEEFSGQITRSGRAVRPAATCWASRRVSRTWLSSTARRWFAKSSPARGTLPWTAATVITRSPGAAAACAGTARPTAGPTSTATRAPASAGARRSGSTTVNHHRPAPESTTPKLTSGAPPSEASRAYAPPAWPKASLAQGNPPQGTRSTTASPATQRHATHSGVPGRWRTSGNSATGIATATTTTASAPSQTAPTYVPVQCSSGYW